MIFICLYTCPFTRCIWVLHTTPYDNIGVIGNIYITIAGSYRGNNNLNKFVNISRLYNIGRFYNISIVGIVIYSTRPRQAKLLGIKASCYYIRQVTITSSKLPSRVAAALAW